jgi:ABC-2 type transport system ATP-binding protein
VTQRNNSQLIREMTIMSVPIIQTAGLTRVFKNNRAVDSMNLEIYPGELYGLVGPDGAGKTTFLRLLAGLLDVTEGSATIAGFDLIKEPEAIKPKVGYMAQQFSLYAELSVLENLTFFADLFDVDKISLSERIDRLISFAGLMEFKNRWAAHLSGGMQKKLALACTLIHQPPILLLDEPTTGVDPVSRREFWNILTELHLEGTTIIVSTPYMDEADRCSMVGLMYKGKLVISATPPQIRSQIKGDLIEVYPEEWQKALLILETLPGLLEIQTYGEALHILVDSAEKRLPQLEKLLKENNLVYHGARSAPARMEEAFISLIRQISSEN